MTKEITKTTGVPGTTQQTQAPEPPAKTSRETWMENIKAKYPDRDFSNEDEYYKTSMEGYDSDHEANKKMKADNEALTQKLTENPDVAMFFASIINGEDFWRAKAYLDEITPKEEGDEGWEAYNKGVAERKAQAEAADKAVADFVANKEKSIDALKTFASETGLSEEDAVKFVDDIRTTIADKLFSGDLDVDFFKKMYNLIHYDETMADARRAGEIEGKNATIDEARKKQTKTDGLPSLGTGGKAPAGGATTESPTLASLKSMSADHQRRTRML